MTTAQRGAALRGGSDGSHVAGSHVKEQEHDR
jgi:hypothetical protein